MRAASDELFFGKGVSSSCCSVFACFWGDRDEMFSEVRMGEATLGRSDKTFHFCFLCVVYMSEAPVVML